MLSKQLLLASSTDILAAIHFSEGAIYRRYERGQGNLIKLSLPLCDRWMVYNNSGSTLRLIDKRLTNQQSTYDDLSTWNQITGGSVTERERQRLHGQIDTGVKAVTQALERPRKLGEQIAIWQDGKVIVLKAEKISQSQQGSHPDKRVV